MKRHVIKFKTGNPEDYNDIRISGDEDSDVAFMDEDIECHLMIWSQDIERFIAAIREAAKAFLGKEQADGGNRS